MAEQPKENYRVVVAYDGRDFHGWQRHRDKPTVQGALEDALRVVFGRVGEVRGAGRTDRGAHANAQVASVRLPRGAEASGAQLAAALPSSIRVTAMQRVPEAFHARSSASGKRYLYRIHNAQACPKDQIGRVWHVPGRLAVEPMRAVLPLFMGALDFASFATKPKHERASTVRTVTAFTLRTQGPALEFAIEADGFLYKMVRNIIRTVVKAGEGRYSVNDVENIIAARDRQAAPGTAPASGLTLDHVEYPPEAFVFEAVAPQEDE